MSLPPHLPSVSARPSVVVCVYVSVYVCCARVCVECVCLVCLCVSFVYVCVRVCLVCVLCVYVCVRVCLLCVYVCVSRVLCSCAYVSKVSVPT